jgi:ribosomal protein L7/L12
MGSDDAILDHARRISTLEAQVAALTKRLGAADAAASSAAQEASGFGFASDAQSTDATNDPRIAELISSGNKIGAIKLYRELTGVGLAEAKAAIDAM